MTNLEISKALALAIGWTTDRMFVSEEDVLELRTLDHAPWGWRPFDYRDWNVIAPIAQRYDCFPVKSTRKNWVVYRYPESIYADTPQKAIALAVINSKGQLS